MKYARDFYFGLICSDQIDRLFIVQYVVLPPDL